MKNPFFYSIRTKKILLLLLFVGLCTQPLFVQERFRRTPPKPQPIEKPNLPLIENFSFTNGLSLALVREKSLGKGREGR